MNDARAGSPLREVTVRDVTVEHGRAIALHRCSLTLRAGECVAVLGPNGAGKSTLLSVLAGLRRPSSGAVSFDGGRSAATLATWYRARVGIVAHDALLYGDLTGRENLALWARLYGIGDAGVATWLDRIGLATDGDRPVRTYSRGMRQRLSLARALLSSPSLVLLDEPFTGIDRGGQALVWDLLRELKAQGCIVVVVTHVLDVPEDVFTRTLVLDRGGVRVDRPVGDGLVAAYEAGVRA